MADDTDARGNRALLLAGLGLLVGAVGVWWWSRRDCGCDHSEDAQEGSLLPVEDVLNPTGAIQRWLARGHSAPLEEPAVDPLAWDTHTVSAWGAIPAGPMPLASFEREFEQEFEAEHELGGEG